MRTEFAEQYSRCCIVIDGTESYDDVTERATLDGATYTEDDGDVCFVVRFPDRPQELYTPSALRRSLPDHVGEKP